MSQIAHTSLLGLQLPELILLMEEFGQPAYRARQLFEALYRQRVETLDQISTLPQDFRRNLVEKGISVGLPRDREEICFQRWDGPLPGGLRRRTKR